MTIVHFHTAEILVAGWRLTPDLFTMTVNSFIFGMRVKSGNPSGRETTLTGNVVLQLMAEAA